MAGSKNEVNKVAPNSVAVAKKIAIHAKGDPCGERFFHYMRLVSALKRNAVTSRTRSPWLELRNYGALEAIMAALKTVFLSEEFNDITNSNNNNKQKSKDSIKHNVRDICNLALSILSNAFALDYSTRSEAIRNGFISSLQQFIGNLTLNQLLAFKNAEILARAVKCTANLSNDPQCRESILKTGVAISILKILEFADEKMSSTACKVNPTENNFVDKSGNKYLICSCVRALRILTSDSKFLSNARDHLRFGGLVTIVNVLTWNSKLSSDEDVILDVIRALTFLSLRIRSAPSDAVDKLIYNPDNCKLICLVKLFETTEPEGKLHSPVIKCLINLSANKQISDSLGELRIIHIILKKLETIDEIYFHDLFKLLIALTKYSSFNQSHLASSQLVGSTLKILKSSYFREYHGWLLSVYEKLYNNSLNNLIQCGLVDHLCDILREEIEDCDYESLRSKISSLDDGKCSVHAGREQCPFIPMYRCSSPSYQKIQEEMKTKVTIAEDMDIQEPKTGEDSLSPFSSPSPAHSWASGGSSPRYSDVSHTSYSSFTEDEGCYSPSDNHTNKNVSNCILKLAGGSDEETEILVGEERLQPPPSKKPKLDHTPIQKCEKSLEMLKKSVKRIVGVLNILVKCTYEKQFPHSILQIAPLLLGIILRGKVSMMSQRAHYQQVEYDDELHDLSRRTFEVSYKIILNMCSNIQMFPEIIISSIVPVLYRLQQPTNTEDVELNAVVQKYCSNLIDATVGENSTAGWREGHIMRRLLVTSTEDEKNLDQLIVNIPLLYQTHPLTLRKFEYKAKSWSKILEMLDKSDDISFNQFEDCTLALCSLCAILGVQWKALNSNDDELPVLFQSPGDMSSAVIVSTSNNMQFSETDSEHMVKLVLDDGTIYSVQKELLVQASPVFSAMFNGHFIEAGQQKVYLPNVSSSAALLLLEQLFMLYCPPTEKKKLKRDEPQSQSNEHELSIIFELFALADRFLLEDLYGRALNTVLTQYICPHSAPIIYAESVKLGNLQKSGNNREMLGDVGLNFFILKYILTAKTVRMAERCIAIRKIFDSVIPSHVVQDLRTLIEQHMYKS